MKKKKNSNETEQASTRDADANMELLHKITELVSGYADYNSPYLRSDGDIIITLDPNIKRKRRTTQNFTDAIKLMMNEKHPLKSGR